MIHSRIAYQVPDSNHADGGICVVSLIDRRTGQPHRINGASLTALTRLPDEAAAEFLAGRDPALWEVRVQRLGKTATRQ